MKQGEGGGVGCRKNRRSPVITCTHCQISWRSCGYIYRISSPVDPYIRREANLACPPIRIARRNAIVYGVTALKATHANEDEIRRIRRTLKRKRTRHPIRFGPSPSPPPPPPPPPVALLLIEGQAARALICKDETTRGEDEGEGRGKRDVLLEARGFVRLDVSSNSSTLLEGWQCNRPTHPPTLPPSISLSLSPFPFAGLPFRRSLSSDSR